MINITLCHQASYQSAKQGCSQTSWLKIQFFKFSEDIFITLKLLNVKIEKILHWVKRYFNNNLLSYLNTLFCYFCKRVRKISELLLLPFWIILSLRILRKKTRLQIKPTCLRKYEYGYLGNWYIKSSIYKRFLYSNLIF